MMDLYENHELQIPQKSSGQNCFFFNETLAMLPKLSKALNRIHVICLQLAC